MGTAQLAWCFINVEICLDAQLASRKALATAAELGGSLAPGQQNAVQHALWMTLMIARYGIAEEDALALGVAHEIDGGGDAAWGTDSSKVDLHNNFFGARLGRAIVAQGTPVSEVENLAMTILVAFVSGKPCPQCPSVVSEA